MAATLVANGDARLIREAVQILQQFFDGFSAGTWNIDERFIEVCDVGGVMLVVMNFHRFGVDMRFQGVKGIWKRRKFERACRSGLSFDEGHGAKRGSSD